MMLDAPDELTPNEAAPSPLTAPTMVGSFVLGGVMSVSVEPTWRDPQPDSTYHKWLRDEETSETAATHTIVIADVGHTVRAEVVGQHCMGSAGVVSNGAIYDFATDQPTTQILLYGDVGVTGDPVADWQSDDPNLGPDFSQLTGSKQPIVGSFGGRASVDADGVDDLLEDGLYGILFGVTQIWAGFSFKLLTAATDTNSGVNLWQSHLIFGDANGYFGAFIYKDGADTKVAATFLPSSGPYLTTASKVLTIGSTYWAEIELLSGGNFSLRVNNDFDSSISTGGLPMSAGVLASNLRLYQGARPVTAGVALGDLCAMTARPDTDHLAAARRWFASRRTGVVTP